eukprot:TRINITY_DN20348_c0_g1_i1.p1 TRINITY_DN20348_c0_g1~~TRINITY_DN20348_c0_g1_i1.p1  ORF type:complete len:157 (-),score=8.41 TRINITY_DN20348_c0_g1_i1:420-890(-)
MEESRSTIFEREYKKILIAHNIEMNQESQALLFTVKRWLNESENRQNTVSRSRTKDVSEPFAELEWKVGLTFEDDELKYKVLSLIDDLKTSCIAFMDSKLKEFDRKLDSMEKMLKRQQGIEQNRHNQLLLGSVAFNYINAAIQFVFADYEKKKNIF